MYICIFIYIYTYIYTYVLATNPSPTYSGSSINGERFTQDPALHPGPCLDGYARAWIKKD